MSITPPTLRPFLLLLLPTLALLPLPLVPRLEHPRVVAPAGRALVVEEVVGHLPALLPAVVAEDARAPRGELGGHGRGLHPQVERREVRRHVLHRLLAERAGVGRGAVLLVAVAVHGVTA